MAGIRFTILIFSCIGWCLSGKTASGQHCPPIVESYLSNFSINRNGDSICFHVEYDKTGGQIKASYQAYLLAYKDRESEKIIALTAQEAIENKSASVVSTQLIKLNEQGTYTLEWTLDQQDFVKKMLSETQLEEGRVSDIGGWKQFDDSIRLAIFIPFLDDEKYSTIEGLPEDRHECNYLNESALLFEQLPYRFSVHFGVVQAVRLEEGVFYLQMNGNRPAKSKNPNVK